MTSESKADGPSEAVGIEVFDVAVAAVDLVDLDGIGVEADHTEALFGEGEGERQADVAEADDADDGSVIGDFLLELLGFSVHISHLEIGLRSR